MTTISAPLPWAPDRLRCLHHNVKVEPECRVRCADCGALSPYHRPGVESPCELKGSQR